MRQQALTIRFLKPQGPFQKYELKFEKEFETRRIAWGNVLVLYHMLTAFIMRVLGAPMGKCDSFSERTAPAANQTKRNPTPRLPHATTICISPRSFLLLVLFIRHGELLYLERVEEKKQDE